jgi:hypothetical protein
MKTVSKAPVGIPAYKANAELVRKAALELGLRYAEQQVPGRDNAIRFVFDPMDESMRLKLALSVPQDAYCLDAVAAGGDPCPTRTPSPVGRSSKLVSDSSDDVRICDRCARRYTSAPDNVVCAACGEPRLRDDASRLGTTGGNDISVWRLIGYFVSAIFFLFLWRLGYVIWHMTFLLK